MGNKQYVGKIVENRAGLNQKMVSVVTAYAASFLSIAISFILAREVGVTDFGLYVYGLAIGVFSALFVNMGSENVMVRELTRFTSYKLCCPTLKANMLLRCGLFVIAFLFLLGLILHADQSEDRGSLLIVVTWASLRGLMPSAWFDYLKLTYKQNCLNLVERCGALLLVLLAIRFSSPELVFRSCCAGLLISRVVALFVQYAVWFCSVPEPNSFVSFRDSKCGATGMSVKIAASLLLNASVGYGGQIMLEHYGQRAELAAYGLAFQVMGMVIIFQGQTIRLIHRDIAQSCKNKGSALRSSIAKSIVIMGGGTVVLAAGSLALLMILTSNFLGEGYSGVLKYAYLLVGWVLITGVGQPITTHLICLGRDGQYFAVSAFGALCAVTLGLFVIPKYGATGAAVVFVAMRAIVVSIHGFVLCRTIADKGDAAIARNEDE